MSRTFTNRPSTRTNIRGNTRTGIQNRQSQTNAMQATGSSSSNSGLNTGFPGTGRRAVATSASAASVPTVGPARNMSYQGQGQRLGNGLYNDDTDSTERQRNPERTSTYAGGYTVFSPDQRKRDQINQIAQREEQAYQQYKQANSQRHFSHVGTVGGGNMTEEEARRQQAQAVRCQKLNSIKRREELRKAKKMEEEQKIEKMRAEARRKSEQNAIREAGATADAADLRRKRELFLQQLENQSRAGVSSSK